MQLFEGAIVLEVGYGTGEDAITLARRVTNTGRIVAIDRSQVMLEQATANAKGFNLPLEFVLAEAQNLPFDDNTFDAARVDRTLQHIPDPQEAIAKMGRVVRPGGYIVAMEPDWETFTIDSSHHTLTCQLFNFWCDNFPSGWVGRDDRKILSRSPFNR